MPVDRAEVIRTPGEQTGVDGVGDVRDQLAAYRQVLELTDRDFALDVAVWFHTGVLRHRAGELDAAVACFKKAIELAPDDPWAYWELADVYALQADARPAVVVLGAFGDRCVAQGQWSEAGRAFTRAAELAPDDVDILTSLRHASEQAGQKRALPQLDTAIRAARERRVSAAPVDEETGAEVAVPQASASAPVADVSETDLEIVEIREVPRAPSPERKDDGRAVTPLPSANGNGGSAPVSGASAPTAAPAVEGAAGRQRWGDLLGEIVVRQGWVTREQVKDALQLQQRNGAPLGRILVNMQALTEEQLARALALQWNLPYTNLPDRDVDPESAHLLPAYLARRHGVVPIRRANNRLIVAIADPANVVAIDDIRLVTGLDVDLMVASPVDLARVHGMIYGGQADIEEMLKGSVEPEAIGDAPPEDVTVEHLRAMVEDAPIVRAVNQILTQAIFAEASDVHIEPHVQEVKVRFRVDGILQDFMTPPKAVQAALISRIKILANMDIAERRLPQDGHIHLRINGKDFDLRVSSLPTVLGEKVVLRILDPSRTRITLTQLGFADHLLATWENL
ncbi:MAG TPA: ATPase, T2SS/T4P/T4SS family, partial [bacterium]|nr:ATPase, T2SS/T4P/T4SS family [bacterium]